MHLTIGVLYSFLLIILLPPILFYYYLLSVDDIDALRQSDSAFTGMAHHLSVEVVDVAVAAVAASCGCAFVACQSVTPSGMIMIGMVSFSYNHPRHNSDICAKRKNVSWLHDALIYVRICPYLL